MKTDKIITNFKTLTYQEQRDLIERLKITLSESRPILQHKETKKECIHCKSKNVWKHGKYKNGGSRFHCQDCKKSYNELTGTSIHCVKKKDLWDSFIGLMLESKSLRYISKELNISTKTVFDWRHKVLSSFEELFTKEFKGIVETDSIVFRFNEKGISKKRKIKIGNKRGVSPGVSVLFTMDRYKTYDMKVVKIGKVDTKGIERVLDKDRFNDGNVICSDSERCFITLFGKMGLEHHTFKSGNGDFGGGKYHVNTLNSNISKIRSWMRYNFGSVSTKYLSHYLNWYLMLEILKGKKRQEDKFWDYLLMDNETFDRSKDKENNYNEFLRNSGFKGN